MCSPPNLLTAFDSRGVAATDGIVQAAGSLRDGDVLVEVGGQLHQRHLDPLGPAAVAAGDPGSQRLLQRSHGPAQLRAMATKRIQTRIHSADERFHQRLPRVLPMLPRPDHRVQSASRILDHEE
jgi:hypothetical protein